MYAGGSQKPHWGLSNDSRSSLPEWKPLWCSGLVKVYPGGFRRPPTTALAGIDLRLQRGSAYGLVGLNGAGKTTLMKALLAIVRPCAKSDGGI
ncbi:MAG TPA: ATP-binding cassette domain-containing protein [Polyangiaceae bacterium]|nr:ATP-binding cassette domain-containing protein [Polyangiaceae bacterium]